MRESCAREKIIFSKLYTFFYIFFRVTLSSYRLRYRQYRSCEKLHLLKSQKRKFDCKNSSVDMTDNTNSINREMNDCPATSTIHLINLDDENQQRMTIRARGAVTKRIRSSGVDGSLYGTGSRLLSRCTGTDPDSPIYYAKRFGPGRRSVAKTGSVNFPDRYFN